MAGLLGGLGQPKSGCGEAVSQRERTTIIGRLEELADSGALNRQTVDAAYDSKHICSDEADYFHYRIK